MTLIRTIPFLIGQKKPLHPDALIMTFALTASDSITLPTPSGGTYDYYVNWGDGSLNHITSWNQTERTHSYSGKPAGDYTVTITGSLTIINFFSINTSALKIKRVDQFGDTGLTELSFQSCLNLTSIAADLKFYGNSLSNTFSGNSLTSIPSGLFDNCPYVTSFSGTFYINSLTSIPIGLFNNCPLVINFSGTFRLNSITSIPVGLFDNCPYVTSFSSTFRENSLTSIPSGLFDNCPLVTNFNTTFYNNSLTSIPAGLFDYNILVTSFISTFYNNSLTSIPIGLFDYNILVTNFNTTFYFNSLTSIPTGLFNNCPLVTVFAGTFRGNSLLIVSITSLVSGMDMTKVTTTNSMFYECTLLIGNGQALIDKPKAPGYTVGTGSGTGSHRTFFQCTSLADYATISANYK